MFVSILCCLFSISVFAADFSLRFTPQAFIPVDGSLYKMPAGGIGVSGALNFFDHVGVGPEAGFYFLPIDSVDDSLQMACLGLAADAYFFPLSRLMLGLNIGTGVDRVTSKLSSYNSMWWRGNLDVAFRITPEITLAATGGYLNFAETKYFGSPLASGITAGIALRYRISSDKTQGSVIKIDFAQDTSVFPSLYSVYKNAEVGTLSVTNGENVEIHNVKMYFSAGRYTQNEYLFAEKSMIGREQTITVPLNADFAQSILSFEENGKIPGEIRIEYVMLGRKKTVALPMTVMVYQRNSVMWTDASSIAAFVLPTSDSVLLLSKFLGGVANKNYKTGLNRNMQTAMYLIEGLKETGIVCTPDAKTPYAKYHLDSTLVDYVQFPPQTMQYKAGDSDEIALLTASLFESVGIKTMLVPTDNDMIVAYSLDISKIASEPLFENDDDLIEADGVMWIPLSMNAMQEGYTASAAKGAKAVRAQENEEHIVVSDAWRTYPPAEPENMFARGFKNPSEKKFSARAAAALETYLAENFDKRIAKIREEIRKSKNPADLYNTLGLIYIRRGDYDTAAVQFTKGSDLGSVSAMVNMGNIYMLRKNYNDAQKWYAKALSTDPNSKNAQNGLQRARDAAGVQ